MTNPKPPPLVIRQAFIAVRSFSRAYLHPPKPLSPVQTQVVTIKPNNQEMAFPRKVIVERLATIPSSPQPIVIEKWFRKKNLLIFLFTINYLVLTNWIHSKGCLTKNCPEKSCLNRVTRPRQTNTIEMHPSTTVATFRTWRSMTNSIWIRVFTKHRIK